MPEANLEIARSLYGGTFDLVEVFASSEMVELLRPLMDPDLEAVFADGGIPMGAARVEPESETGQPTVRGFDEFIRTWREWISVWETWVMTPTDFVEIDKERVLIPMTVKARSKTHGVEFSVDGANILTIRDAKVARLELFFDESAAHTAAGLPQ